MDEDWGVDARQEDWLRGPGDREEVMATVIRLGLEVASPSDALRQAHAAEDEGSEAKARVLLWIGASMGSRKSAFLLGEAVRNFAQTECSSDSARAFYLTMADRWDDHAESDRQEPVQQRRVQERPKASREKVPAPTAEAPPEDADGDGVTVIPRIGDPGTSEGASLAKRYAAAIGRRLPHRAAMPPEGAVAEAIAREWPWAAHAGSHIEGVLSVQRSLGLARPQMRPMLFVGPPGSGKTALARKVAELLGHPPLVVPAGGSPDSAGLSAVTRGWASSRPCGPVIAAAEMGCCDPAVIVDEVDKSPGVSNRNGSASGVLLGMLGDPSSFHDSCLMADVDLSAMMFMATANDLGAVHRALRDRFSVVVVGRPQAEHFDAVLSGLRRRAAERLGVKTAMMPVLDRDEYDALRGHFVSSGGSLRDCERAYDFVLSEAVKREAAVRQLQ